MLSKVVFFVNLKLYIQPKDSKMMERAFYMTLLESRAQRLTELIQISAPNELICREVMLVMEAAASLEPNKFKSFLPEVEKRQFNGTSKVTFSCTG